MQALSWMQEGRWRKARDAAKELVKRERERYLPLLIEANIGLTREMFAKGLLKEAATVVEYLATIAPASLVAGLRAELAAPVIKPIAPDPVKTEAAGWWAAALRVDAAGTAAISAADLAAVDLLVTAALLPSVEDGDERELRLARELAAVRTAWHEAGHAVAALAVGAAFSSASIRPSAGDGTAGGTFNFFFNVLVADVNGSAGVNNTDTTS
ncbi:MAG: hypothetical protein WCJ66_08480, partial [Verrucomicrobiota bacterium]